MESRSRRTAALLVSAALTAAGFALQAQTPAEPAGEWRYIGGDAHHTRYSALDQITAANFEKLEVAWTWRGDNFGPQVDHIFRSTPIYVDGLLYTVAGQRRTVAAIDLPAPGQYGMMGYLHGGRQYVVVQVASGTLPGSLVALRLPANER